MTAIGIHLDGKPVTKLQAARELAQVGGRSLGVSYLVAGVVTDGGITVHARHVARGEVRPPEVTWYAATGRDRISAEAARAFGEAVAVAAEVAELAEMLAAEQDAPEQPPCWCGHAGGVHNAVSNGNGRGFCTECSPGRCGRYEASRHATPDERLLLAIYGVNPDNPGNVRELRRHAAECTEDDHTTCLAHLTGQAASVTAEAAGACGKCHYALGSPGHDEMCAQRAGVLAAWPGPVDGEGA